MLLAHGLIFIDTEVAHIRCAVKVIRCAHATAAEVRDLKLLLVPVLKSRRRLVRRL